MWDGGGSSRSDGGKVPGRISTGVGLCEGGGMSQGWILIISPDKGTTFLGGGGFRQIKLSLQTNKQFPGVLSEGGLILLALADRGEKLFLALSRYTSNRTQAPTLNLTCFIY